MKSSFWGKSASGVLPICITTGRILVGLRSSAVLEPNTWGTFGGAIGLNDAGEEEEHLMPVENALKEIREEIGYNGEVIMVESYVFKSDNFSSDAFHYYNYIGLVATEFEPNPNWEVQEARWVTFAELRALTNLHFGLTKLLLNAFEQIRIYTNHKATYHASAK